MPTRDIRSRVRVAPPSKTPVNRECDTSCGTYMRGTSPAAAAAKKRLGVGVGLGCGCKDAKAVAVAAPSSASPYSTEASTATSSATWRRVRAAAAHPSASGSTSTLTVPSASSSSFPFPWEDVEEADGGGDGEEVDCGKRGNTPSFSGLLRQLNELEQSVVSLGPRQKSASKQSHLSPPPPPPSPPPPLPSRRPVVKQRAAVHSGDRRHDSEEGHGDFSPPPPAPSFQFQTQQQHRKAKSMDKGDRQELAALLRQPSPPTPSLPLQPEQTRHTKSSTHKEDVNNSRQQQLQPQQQAATHRKAKSLDGGGVRLDGTMAVVKHSDDPLSDFRRSMVNMIVENRIATGDELRELLRHFLALNAPHHHDAILRAFTEIWDEAFSTKQAHAPRREPSPAKPTPPQQRRPRHPTRAWR